MKELLVLLAACSGGGSGGNADARPPQGQANIGSFFIESESDTANSRPHASGEADLTFFTGFPACTSVTTIGPCDVRDCVMGPQQTPHSAGTVSVTGPITHFSFEPGGDGEYAVIQAQGALFNGGDSLTVAATGADVPAFSKDISTPSKSTITSPPKASNLPITRSSGLTVTWTGGTTGTQVVSLMDDGFESTRAVFCRFDASAGTGAIPPEALTLLHTEQGTFSMATITDSSVDAADWHIDLEAYWSSVWPDDTLVTGQTMLR
jgi:hypothetical protein